MTSRQNAPCRYIEFEFCLSDRPKCWQDCSRRFMLRLTCSLDPSLADTYSAFSAEGLEAKLQSGHYRQFFSNNGMCHVLLVSLITWNMNSENSEN